MTRLIEKVDLKEQLLLDKRAVYRSRTTLSFGEMYLIPRLPINALIRSFLCNIHFELVGPKYGNKKVVYVIVLKVSYFMQPA